MKLLSPLAVLLSASMAVAIGVTPPRAAATATPQWSGLDTRSYDGAIPGPGGLIATVPLDPALSVTGAGAAYRILYATTNQHDAPAVSTALRHSSSWLPLSAITVMSWAWAASSSGASWAP